MKPVTFDGTLKGVTFGTKIANDGGVSTVAKLTLEVAADRLNLNGLRTMGKGTVRVSLESVQLSLGAVGADDDGAGDDDSGPSGPLDLM